MELCMVCVISIPESELMTVPLGRQIFHRFIFLTYYLVFLLFLRKSFLTLRLLLS